MKLAVSRIRDNPRIVEIEGSASGASWMSVHWEPTGGEIRSHLFGLFRSYRAPSRKQFAELIVSFIPSDSIVYAQFLSHLREIQFIVQDMDRLGLRHEPPIDDGKGFERVVGEVNRDFVLNAFEHYSGWESEKWSLLVTSHRIENWSNHLFASGRGGALREGVLSEARLFLTNRWEHGVDVLSEKMAYDELQEIAMRIAKSLGWELEIT